MSEELDGAYWEERYRSYPAVWSGQPNPQLVAEASDLAPGTALDAGCGEGADAIWLASRGWQVTAVDVATTALRRAREHAATRGADVGRRVDWVRADLASWPSTDEQFDLVSSHYVHLPGLREELFRRLAALVAPGGTLLVVGHHPRDPHHGSGAALSNVRFTAEEVVATLDPDGWEIVVAALRERPAAHGHGDHGDRQAVMRDTVVRARKRVRCPS